MKQSRDLSDDPKEDHREGIAMTAAPHCQLCGSPQGRPRAGRLGRYSVTCNGCEQRKGSHLVRTSQGYAGAAEPTSGLRVA